MELATETIDGVVLITPVGEMDMYSSGTLKELMVRLLGKGEKHFILDLGRLSYVDSSGVGVLLFIYTTCKKRDLQVRFINATGAVARVITLTRLESYLLSPETRDSAVAELSRTATDSRSPGDTEIRRILVDSAHPLFDKTGMFHKEFYIDLSQVRRLSSLIVNKAPARIPEFNILEQQISELIKNAVRHGNKNDKSKATKIWFKFSTSDARLIVEDEGSGFQDLERWNQFYRGKIECYRNNDFEKMMEYLSFRTSDSVETDGGNALSAAVEFWNAGVVFNDPRNAVAVKRVF